VKLSDGDWAEGTSWGNVKYKYLSVVTYSVYVVGNILTEHDCREPSEAREM
jgi:hypothetical protein